MHKKTKFILLFLTIFLSSMNAEKPAQKLELEEFGVFTYSDSNDNENISENRFFFEGEVVINKKSTSMTLSYVSLGAKDSVEKLKTALRKAMPVIKQAESKTIVSIQDDLLEYREKWFGPFNLEDEKSLRDYLTLEHIVYYANGEGFALWYTSQDFTDGLSLNVEFDENFQFSFFKFDG